MALQTQNRPTSRSSAAADMVSRGLLWSAKRVAQELDISEDTLLRLCGEDPNFPAPIRLRGGARHWSRRAIEAYVAKKEQQARKEDRR